MNDSLTSPEPSLIVRNDDDLSSALQGNRQFIIENMSTIIVQRSTNQLKLKTLCKVLETNKIVKKLIVNYLSSTDAGYVADLLRVNESIVDFHFVIQKENIEEQLRRINEALNAKKRRTVKFILENISILIPRFVSSIRAAPVVSAETVSVSPEYSRDIDVEEATMLVDILKETKARKFALIDNSLFGCGEQSVEPFKILTNYLSSQQIITSIKFDYEVAEKDTEDLVHLVDVVKKSKSLRTFKLLMPISPKQFIIDLFNAISTSQLRVLQLIAVAEQREEFFRLLNSSLQKNKTIEKITITRCGQFDIDICKEISKILKENERMTKWHMYQHNSAPDPRKLLWNMRRSTEAGQYLVEAMEQNESMIDLLIDHAFIGTDDNEKLISLTDRNRKMQNTRVRDVITLLFNISRDSLASSMVFPLEIWTLIFSFVHIPGVSLDFGTIFSSLLNDHSIRRVIQKYSKKNTSEPEAIKHVSYIHK